MSYCLTRSERDLLTDYINTKYKNLETFGPEHFYKFIDEIFPLWRSEQLSLHRDEHSFWMYDPYKNYCMYLEYPEFFAISGGHNPSGIYSDLREMVEHEESISYEQFCSEHDIENT